MNKGKFDFLKTAREETPEAASVPLEQVEKPATPRRPRAPRAAPTPPLTPPSTRGRPANGKRSNPDYEQVSCYLRRVTHAEVQVRLIREGKKRDVSDLIEELLSEWLAKGG